MFELISAPFILCAEIVRCMTRHKLVCFVMVLLSFGDSSALSVRIFCYYLLNLATQRRCWRLTSIKLNLIKFLDLTNGQIFFPESLQLLLVVFTSANDKIMSRNVYFIMFIIPHIAPPNWAREQKSCIARRREQNKKKNSDSCDGFKMTTWFIFWASFDNRRKWISRWGKRMWI